MRPILPPRVAGDKCAVRGRFRRPPLVEFTPTQAHGPRSVGFPAPPQPHIGMKVTEVVCQILRIPNIQAKTASSQDSVLVRVRTDTGLEGVGEADSSPEVV